MGANMERLTVKRPDGRWAIANNDNANPMEQMLKIPLVIDRLAAYEDTGLEPGEIATIKANYEDAVFYKAQAEANMKSLGGLDRMTELVNADREGRLVVLPCKVGDTVWLLHKRCKHAGEQNKPWDSCEQYWKNVYSKKMWGCAGTDDEGNKFYCENKEMVWYAKEMQYSLILYRDDIVLGKNLFLTREEAERALEEQK